jgi:POT family proton-dependent oligopeptide transporter
MNTAPGEGKQFFGHPRGLATLFFTEMWERFSYYGMRALLILFMTAAVEKGGLGIDARHAGAIYGLVTSGVYLFSLPGGWIADRLIGQRNAVFAGGVLISLGNFMLSIPAGAPLFFAGLLTVAVGTGLLKPNVSCVVGQLYEGQRGARRDAAFSIFYLGINLGATIAPFVSGTVGETIGYRWGFLAAGFAMIIGLVQYRLTGHHLRGAGELPLERRGAEQRRNLRRFLPALAAFLVAVLLVAFGVIPVDPLQLANIAGVVMIALAVLFFGSVLLLPGLSGAEKRNVGMIVLLFVSSTVFWAGYEQAGSTLNLFARDYIDRSLFGTWFVSGAHPASWYQAVPPIFVILLAPLFGWLWIVLDRRDRDPSAVTKLGLGLLQLGLSFIVMMLAAQLAAHSGQKVLPTWLIVTYFLQTTGELCLSPIGLSNVTKLAPVRYVGQMMGTWFLATALGNLAAGLIGGEIGSGAIEAMPQRFLWMALIGGGAGAVMLLIAMLLRKRSSVRT